MLLGTSCPSCGLGVCCTAPGRCSQPETFPPRAGAFGCSLLRGGALNLACQSRGLLGAEAACTMLSSALPPLLLLLTVLELSWSLSDEEKKIILDGHNKYRSQVSPPAMDMLKMVSGLNYRGLGGGLCSASPGHSAGRHQELLQSNPPVGLPLGASGEEAERASKEV